MTDTTTLFKVRLPFSWVGDRPFNCADPYFDRIVEVMRWLHGQGRSAHYVNRYVNPLSEHTAEVVVVLNDPTTATLMRLAL